MKKAYFRLVFAALTAAALLAGCAKEKVNGQAATEPAVQAEGSRTIAVSFAPQTKTALGEDGLTPEFKAYEDTIKVAKKDGSASPEDCPVYIENGIAVIHTDLEGELDAVYPSSAAKVKDNFIVGVSVPSKQTGKFADANICSTTIPAGSQSATFENKTAILKFYVDKTIGVKSITIAGKENVADGSESITIDGTDETSILSEISKGPSNERICYVAVLAGIHSALQFTSETSTQSAPVQKQLQPVTLLPGTMYNVFLPYYIQVGDQKWGYCNVGAFLPEEPGYYFSWGNVEGYNLNGKSDTYSFTIEEYKKTKGYQLSKNISPDNDAAYKNWGASWRIPTIAEFLQTNNFNNGEWVDDNFGIAGYLFETSKLFLPAAGYYDMERYPSYEEYSTHGRYWTSDYKDDGEHAGLFHVDKENKWETADSRYRGYPIRPIYGDSAPEVLPEILPGVFTVGPGKDEKVGSADDVKVNFLRGNLWWQESNNSWHIENQQYDVPETYSREHLGLFYYFGDAAVSNYGTNDLTQITDEDTDESIRKKYGACFEYYASDADWGKAYGKGHTLTFDEWGYLLSFDKNKSQYLVDDDPDESDFNLAKDYSNDIRKGRYKEKVDVVGHIGMLLVPDDWDLTNMPLKSSYSESEWKTAQAAGAVFLPYVMGECTDGKVMIIPSQEYHEMYMKMVEELEAKDPTEEFPEYSDLIRSYFFCQGLYGEDFVVLTDMLNSTNGNTVMVTWYNWDMLSPMRLVEYAK